MTDNADLNAAIRRASGPVGRVRKGTPNARSIERSGRPPDTRPSPSPLGRSRAHPDDRLRALVATDAGLPVEWGERLSAKPRPSWLRMPAGSPRWSSECRRIDHRIRWRGA